jgi:hypothetical protein
MKANGTDWAFAAKSEGVDGTSGGVTPGGNMGVL